MHREDKEKLNTEFKMREIGIHCYNPTDKEIVIINKVSRNNKGSTKR